MNEFLKDYYNICKKHNLQFVATQVFSYNIGSLDITDLSNDVLNDNNVYALDIDVDFDNGKVSYWDKDNSVRIELNDV